MSKFSKAITKIQTIIVALLLIVAAIGGGLAYYYYSTSGTPSTTAEPLRIGIQVPLTGTQAYMGPEIMDGALSAVYDVNAAGGVLGKLVEVYTEDDQSNAAQAVTVVTKMITVNNVKVIVGALISAQVLAAAPVVIENQVPYLVVGASDDIAYLNDSGFVYRAGAQSCGYGSVLADAAVNQVNASKVGMLTETGASGLQIGAACKARFASAYPKVSVQEIQYSPADVDYTGIIATLMANNPDTIITNGISEKEIIGQLQGFASVGYTGHFVIGAWAISRTFTDTNKQYCEGMVVVAAEPYQSIPYVNLVKHMNTYFPNMAFSHYQPVAIYDAVTIACLAAIQAGSTTNGTAIRNAINKVVNPPGITVTNFTDAKTLIAEGQKVNFDGVFITGWNEYGDVAEIMYTVYTVTAGQWIRKGSQVVPPSYTKPSSFQWPV